MPKYPHLLESYTLGSITLKNSAVMAPMTRSRAIGNIPDALMAEYYAQRASAGLIITEGVAPSPNGLGYARIPGLFNAAQVEGWRLVTNAVHAAGGHIFAQLMHTGRVSHPANMPQGAEVVAPSALALAGEMYTDSAGPQPHPTPRAMDEQDIETAIEAFVQAARHAIEAGFDGVELHGANGYLIEQFLNPAMNQREDDWGNTWQARNRFAVEVARRTAAAIGPDRVGIRLSPHGANGGAAPAYDTLHEQYVALVEALSDLGLVYLHLVDHAAMGAPEVPDTTKAALRDAFAQTLILSGGYDAPRAEADLSEGRANLVAFGRPFLANPDLLARFEADAPLNEVRYDRFFTTGPEGYTDYPTI